MEKYIHSRKHRVEAKRRDVIESAIATVEAVAEGRIDPYEGWQKVCGIFQNNAGLGLLELKPFVQIEGIHPNSTPVGYGKNSAIQSGEMLHGSSLADVVETSRLHSLTNGQNV